jgi:hypothetical protein
MGTLQIDPSRRIARASAGATWHHVIAAAAPYGLAPLSGSSPGVGVVGYTLGGGVGLMARSFGFSADHVRSIQVVTADGRLRVVDPGHDPDLFWALRGGKGSFGVVSSIEFDLLPVRRIVGGSVFFSGSDLTAGLAAYRAWCRTLPESTTTSMAVVRLPPLPQLPEPIRGTVCLQLRFVHLGEPAEAHSLLAPLRADLPPLLDTVAEMDYADSGRIYNDPVTPMPSVTGGVFLSDLTDRTIDALAEQLRPEVETPLVMVEVRQLGGALAREPRIPNAVCGRDAAFVLGAVGIMPPALSDATPRVLDHLLAGVTDSSIDLVPVNYRSALAEGERPGRAWSATTYRRLQDVKAIYDPRNLFRSGYPVQAGVATTSADSLVDR